MRNNYLKLILLLTLCLAASLGWSVITDYNFTTTTTTYTPLTDGTIHGTDTNNEQVFNAVPLGFTFNYNGTDYTQISISCNGFIAMGATVTTSNTAISTGTTNNVIVAMNRDLISRTGGTLLSAMSGTAPNRVFTVQWAGYRRNNSQAVNDTLNFQIKLYETTNLITFNYGHSYTVTASLAATVQVGLRGASNTEYTNRTTTTNWAATTAGTANNSTCALNATVYPAEGLTFNWTPPSAGTPPNPAQYVSPANNATQQALGVNLTWLVASGNPTGYKVYLGTDNPPTNMVNGTVVTGTVYDHPTNFAFNTLLYWQIVPYNDFGDATGCPIWSFTTMPDPTVTTLPYTMNWDSVTAPVVPPSWTIINANSDAFTWVTVSSGAYSAPNALRCAFNSSTAIAMDDWAISPPIQLTGGSFYRIQFRYKAQNGSLPEKMEIKYGMGNTIADLTEQIYLNESIANTGYLLGEAFMSPTSSGLYHFGFHGFSNPNMYYLFIDDINVSEVIPVFNPPQNLTATTGNGTVSLAWQLPAPATRAIRGYHVFRNGTQITAEIVTALNYVDSTAPVGTACNYYVKAIYINPNGTSDPSNTVTITPSFAPPTNLQAVSGATSVVLTWTAPAGVTPSGYNVYSNGEMLNPVPITLLTYTDNTATVGFTQSYYVTALYSNPDGESAPSNSVIGEIIAPPTELNATVSNPNVILTWISPFVPARAREDNQPTRDLIGFKIYRNAVLVGTVTNPDVETYTDTNLVPDTYTYTVTANYTSGESTPAGPVQATVTAAFFPPSNLTATGSITGIRLTWNRPSPLLNNLSGYRVFRDGLAQGHGLVADTTYNDVNIINGVVYTYYVTAVYANPNGESAPSNTASASGGETLNPVTNLQCSVAQDNVSLTWVPPGGPILQDWIHFDDNVNYAGIGTNAAANFDIAARFTPTELSGLTERWVTKVRFFPKEANCVYSIKIWTGGSTYTNPGNLILTLPVTDPTIDAWNTVTLPEPIQIPSIGDMWVGVNINTQGGYPAGCDDGPSQPYKGNMIYINNEWTILSALGTGLDYNWNIQAFVVNFIGRETLLSHAAATAEPVTYPRVDTSLLQAQVNPDYQPAGNTRDGLRPLTGYKIYRDGINIAQISDYTVTGYTDMGLPNGTFTYTVTAVYTTGESAPSNPAVAVVDVYYTPTIHQTGFEEFADFSTSFGTWMTLDGDNSATYGMTDVDFPGEADTMAFMVFNPSATTPPLTSMLPHTGQKLAVCIAATTPPNNDWLISPRYRLGTSENKLTFWARSLTDQYGLERFRVGISTATFPTAAQFIWLSGTSYLEAPAEWTMYEYIIPGTYNAQFVRFGIKCESNDAFVFMVDDWKLQGVNGVANEDEVVPVSATALLGNYPNPFNPETSISYSVKQDAPVTLEIYNLKGQKVRTLVDGNVKAGSYKITWKGDDDNGRPVSSGVYFYKMMSGKYTASRKMILMK
jgi:hypothetical protein